MKILLTGSHGFIGSHVAQELYKHKVIYWDRKIGKPLKKLVKRDLVDIDVVIHLAASISVPHSYADPEAYFQNNASTTLTLAKKAAEMGVKKFIFASSSSVYAKPLSPYGASKLSAEHCLEAFSDKMKIHRLRFFNVYGPSQNREFPGVITKMLHCIKNDSVFEINGDGNQTRDYTYVKDIARVIKKLVESDLDLKDPLDLGASLPTSLNDLVAIVQTVTGKKLNTKFVKEQKEIRSSQSIRPPKELIEEFTPLEVGVKETYEA